MQEEDDPEPLTPLEAGASESDTPGGAGTPRWARCSRPASAAPVSASPGRSPRPSPTRPCCRKVPGRGDCACKWAPPTPPAPGIPTRASGGHGHRAQGEPTIQSQARASIPSHLSKPAGRCHHPPSLPQRRGCGLREVAQPRGNAGARSLDAAQGRAPAQPGPLRILRQAASRPQTSALAGRAFQPRGYHPLDHPSPPTTSLAASRSPGPPPPQLVAPA